MLKHMVGVLVLSSSGEVNCTRPTPLDLPVLSWKISASRSKRAMEAIASRLESTCDSDLKGLNL